MCYNNGIHKQMGIKMILTIAQKQSNSGSIYDIASDKYAIKINFKTIYHYAVACPPYFNIHPTRHKTEEAAIKAYKKMEKRGYSATILDRSGREYHVVYGDLLT